MASSKFALPAGLLLLTLPPIAGATVQVMVGPTPIQDGEARSAGDITVVNESWRSRWRCDRRFRMGCRAVRLWTWLPW